MVNLGILISGRGSNMEALINASEFMIPSKVKVVIADRDTEGLKFAESKNIPNYVVLPEQEQRFSNNQSLTTSVLKKHNVDLVCCAGFMRILTPDFIKEWEWKILNIHPSLLPAFPGLNVHKRVLQAGVRFTGCTVHYVDTGVDTGPIIVQAAIPVFQNDTENMLAARVLKHEHKIYPMAVEMIANKKIGVKDKKAVFTEEEGKGSCYVVGIIHPSFIYR